MNILQAEKEDLPEILALQHLAYQSEARLLGDPHIPPLTQTLEDIQGEFDRGLFLKVPDPDGAIIASVRVFSREGTAHVGKLIVHPDRQGRGIGTRLLREVEAVCPHPRYELFTSSRSERNIRLYQRLGYVPFRERRVREGLIFVYLEKIIPREA